MRVVLCSEFGPLDRLTVQERPPAACGARDVRIAVTAAGLNFVDALFVQGLYQIKPPLPFVPGNEIAGVVSEVGAEVTTFAIGDRVLANVGLGGYASEVVTDARRVIATPATLTDGQAATFTQSYMTARFALHQRARAQPGQWLLVLGAGGGVGLAAVDVGRAMGLRVIAVASTEAKRQAALDRGAEAVIDSTKQDVKTVAREIADGDGVDLVYDPVGGAAGELALRTLREDGQFIVIGFASGEIPKLPANQVLLRNRRVTGVDWGAWVGRNQAANHEMMLDLLADIAARKLTPIEPITYPLDQAAQALQDQLDRKVTGKAALVP